MRRASFYTTKGAACILSIGRYHEDMSEKAPTEQNAEDFDARWGTMGMEHVEVDARLVSTVSPETPSQPHADKLAQQVKAQLSEAETKIISPEERLIQERIISVHEITPDHTNYFSEQEKVRRSGLSVWEKAKEFPYDEAHTLDQLAVQEILAAHGLPNCVLFKAHVGDFVGDTLDGMLKTAKRNATPSVAMSGGYIFVVFPEDTQDMLNILHDAMVINK